MRAIFLALCAVSAFGLSACGDTVAEQALFGAGVGAAGATAVRGDPITGAFVGAAGNVAYCQAHPEDC